MLIYFPCVSFALVDVNCSLHFPSVHFFDAVFTSYFLPLITCLCLLCLSVNAFLPEGVFMSQ